MFSKIKSFVLTGLDCREVEIEADKAGGMHNFTLVGLGDTAVKESKERVSSAIKNSGFKPPYHFGRITVCLAPSSLKKSGSGLDLPIAISILEATEQLPGLKEKAVYVGELSLNGNLRKTNGILPVVIEAAEKGYKKIFVPAKNYKEASLIQGIEIIPLRGLNDYVEYFEENSEFKDYLKKQKKKILKLKNKKAKVNLLPPDQPLITDVKGQEKAKRALLIIAAGNHNLLFNGPPGTGKTFLARALASILPPLNQKEQLEATKIYSVAGLLPEDKPLIQARPFRSPHHTASSAALVGGGSKIKPGEITLAHRGVLFLDEILEFPQKTLDSLRQPLEDGLINISRASGTVGFPCNFILVGAMNPCPCGYLGDEKKKCTCTPFAVSRYRQRLSGPIIDRIDLFVEVLRVKYKKLTKTEDQATEQKELNQMRELVKKTREIQGERFQKESILTNSEMSLKEIERYCVLDKESSEFFKKAVEAYQLSTRSYFRVLKVARTIADLSTQKNIQKPHVAEALQFQLREV
jgi:magnesium chelatase family protein